MDNDNKNENRNEIHNEIVFRALLERTEQFSEEIAKKYQWLGSLAENCHFTVAKAGACEPVVEKDGAKTVTYKVGAIAQVIDAARKLTSIPCDDKEYRYYAERDLKSALIKYDEFVAQANAQPLERPTRFYSREEIQRMDPETLSIEMWHCITVNGDGGTIPYRDATTFFRRSRFVLSYLLAELCSNGLLELTSGEMHGGQWRVYYHCLEDKRSNYGFVDKDLAVVLGKVFLYRQCRIEFPEKAAKESASIGTDCETRKSP